MSEIYWGSRIYNDRFGVDFLKPSEDGFLFRGKFDATIPSNTVFGGFYDESKNYNDVKTLSVNAHSSWVSSNGGKTFTKSVVTPGVTPTITFSAPDSEVGSVYRVAIETASLGVSGNAQNISVDRYDGNNTPFVLRTYTPDTTKNVHVYDVDSISTSSLGGFSVVGSANTVASVNILYAKKSGGHRIYQSNGSISPSRVVEPLVGAANLLSNTEGDMNLVLDVGGTGTGSLVVSDDAASTPPSGVSTKSVRLTLGIGGPVESGNTNYAGAHITMSNAIVGRQYTSSVWMKSETDVTVLFDDSTGGFPVKRTVDVSNDWVRHTFTAIATSTTFRPISISVKGSEGTDENVVVYMCKPQVEFGPIATKTQSSHDGYVTSIGSPKLSGVEFNSVNSEYLLTTYTPGQETGEIHFIAKNTTPGGGSLFGVDSGSNRLGLGLNSGGGSVTITSYVGSTTNAHIVPGIENVPTVFGLSYTDNSYSVYVNGVSLGVWPFIGTIPNSPINIGSRRTTSGISDPFSGRVYGGGAISGRVLSSNERHALVGFLRHENTIYNSRHYKTVGSWKPSDMYARNLGFYYDTSNELVSTELVGNKTPEYGETVTKMLDVHSGSSKTEDTINATQPSLAKQPIYVYSPAVGRRNMLSFSNRLGQAPWSLLSARTTLDTSDTIDGNEVYSITTSGSLGNSHYVRQTTIHSIEQGKNVVVSAYVKPLGPLGINRNFSIELQLNGDGVEDVKRVTFNLIDETVVFSSPGVVGGVSRIVGGWLRISLSYPNVPSYFNVSSGVKYGYISNTPLTSHGSVKISMPQFELVTGTNSPATRYQSVINNGFIFDQDSKSFKAIRFDNVDDCFETVVPDWLFDAKGTFYAFGTAGSIVTPADIVNRSIVFSSLNCVGFVGPTPTYDLGDVVGYGFVDRSVSDDEILKLKHYYGSIGSGGTTTVIKDI